MIIQDEDSENSLIDITSWTVTDFPTAFPVDSDGCVQNLMFPIRFQHSRADGETETTRRTYNIIVCDRMPAADAVSAVIAKATVLFLQDYPSERVSKH